MLDQAASRIKKEIDRLLEEKSSLLVALDGPSTSGKSSLGSFLSSKYGYGLITLDDFFLRETQRTPNRLAEVGGNIDYERFEEQVLLPLSKGQDITFRPYDCQLMGYAEEKKLFFSQVIILEGSYSHHPRFTDYYDLRVFLKIGKDSQLERLRKRNPLMLDMFLDVWVPKEEEYFQAFEIEKKADLIINMDKEKQVSL